MSLTTRVGLLAGASALTLTGASFGSQTATETSTEALRAEIAALKAQVARLATGEDWLTEQRSDEIRSLVQDVLADADTRASLLQSGMNAGYDDGFVLGSSDGNFSLKMNGLLQARFVYNNQDDAPVDDDRWGFENSRTKLWFSGNVVSPEWMYMIEADFGTNGAFTLQDAYIAHDCGNGWTGIFGQHKAPALREELVHSSKQLLVERSWVNEFFTGGRSQYLAADYLGEQFHFTACISDGANNPNSAWSNYDTEWALTGRVEVLFAGNWDQFKDFTSWQGEEFGFMLGAAAHYQSAEYGTAANDEIEVFLGTIDASAEFGGGNLFASLIYRNMDNDAAIDSDQYGLVVQGGFFLNEDWELFGRWEWADLDTNGVDDLNIFTVGLNKYWAEHTVKWTSDVGFGIDSVPFTSNITGWRADTAEEDGQVVFRTQLQLMF